MLLVWMVAGLMAVAGSAYAGSACCSAKGKGKAADSVCAKATAGLELTEEQKAKIAGIEAECQSAGSTEDSCRKAKGEIRDVLNDEQKVQFDAAWDKNSAKKGSCQK